MKIYFSLLLSLIISTANAQKDSTANKTGMEHAAFRHNTVTGTIAVGFIDWYRHYYSLPPAFQKSNTTGYIPVYGKVEYAFSRHWGIAAAFSYDAFETNFNELYTGNNGPFTRYKTNNVRVFSGGLMAYYHFTCFKHASRLDPFIGFGLSLYNTRYSAFPQGDSTVVALEHAITPVLRAGVRYYISDAFSLYGDAGFDRQSVFSLGFSCRFFRKPQADKTSPAPASKS